MPPRRPPRGPGPHLHRHALSSLAEMADAQRLEDALALVISDPRDRAFVARCILSEGPAHHRAASWTLCVVAAEAAARAGARPREHAEADDFAVPLRLPPHVATGDDGAFPLAIPMAPLRAITGDERGAEVLADALVDGPPHHALANAALVAILERLLAALAPADPG